MKILILALGLFSSFAALAQSVAVYPNVINLGNAVQVQIYNTTEHDIDCSGTLTLHTQMNQVETHYYNEFIRSRQSSYSQMFYLRNYSDRISFANEHITCYKAN